MTETLGTPRAAQALSLDAIAASPNALAADYSRFRVDERLLLTGHSHQAWPDRAFDGQVRAYLDAAELVDEKWDRAFAAGERFRDGLAAMHEDTEGSYTLSGNTHDLVLRFLSALPLVTRPKLVTTDGEFHTIRRQLARLDEVTDAGGSRWLEIVRVPAQPVETVAARLADAVDDRTSAVLASVVFFGTGRIVEGLRETLDRCRHHGAELLIDAYHATGVVPLSLPQQGLTDAYLVGGGYKYMQMGEGNCWMRVPPGRRPRPVITGWFADFSALSQTPGDDRVAYGEGATAYAGATYDPTCHYRAAAVLDYWDERGLTPNFLRQVSQHQVRRLAHHFDQLDLPASVIARDREVDLAKIGGFLTLDSSKAGELSHALRRRGVLTDFRGRALRFGPAPYLSDAQLEAAMGHLGEVVASVGSQAP